MLCVLLRPEIVAGESSDSGAELLVEVERGRLTLRAENQPLAEVLREISEAAGFELVVKGDLKQRVDRSFSGVPLDKAMRQLLRGVPHIVAKNPSADASGRPTIWQVRVSGQGTGATRYAGSSGGSQSARAGPSTSSAAEVSRGAPTVQEIQAGLDSKDLAARIQAVRKSLQLDQDSSIEILAEVLARKGDAQVRIYAIRTLTSLEQERVIGILESILRDDDATVKLEAIRALGRIDSEDAAMALRPALIEEQDPKIRRMAVHSVAAGRTEAGRHLLEEAANDSDPMVRRMVKQALAGFN